MDETEGPGLERRYKRFEPVSTTSILFGLLGLIPSAAFLVTFGAEAFGPIEFPAILAIVGVLFGFLAVFRHGELQDVMALRVGIAGAALGLVRLFLYPLFGW